MLTAITPSNREPSAEAALEPIKYSTLTVIKEAASRAGLRGRARMGAARSSRPASGVGCEWTEA